MSTQSDRERRCTGKYKYGRFKAFMTAHNAQRRTGQSITAYRCPYCQAWHIGHTPRKTQP